jgi:hypothetical protein
MLINPKVDPLPKHQAIEADEGALTRAPCGAEKLLTEAAAEVLAMNEDPTRLYRMGPTGKGFPWKRRAGWGLCMNPPVDAPVAEKIAAYMKTATQYQELAAEARKDGLHTMASDYSKRMIMWLDEVSKLEREQENHIQQAAE